MATQRVPMKFNVLPDPVATPLPPPASIPRAIDAERQQVGARVSKAAYRQLKARAALAGETVQALVERAIDEFLAKLTS